MRDLTWFDYTLIGWLFLGLGATAALVGKPRGPITNGTVVFTLVVTVLLTWGLVTVG